MRVLVLVFATAIAAAAFGFEDEPDEINWDTLGGTVAGFTHFRDYCTRHPEFAKRLLAERRVDSLDSKLETVWITPDAFTNAVVNQWGFGEVSGEKCLTAPSGHCAGMVRIGVDIPADGSYRIWARYWHDQGSAASFGLSLEAGSYADEPDASLSVVQDVFSYRFDFVEFARRQDPLPDRRNDPSGFVWESTPTVRLEKGRRTLALSGLIHEGQYAPRRVTAIVLTREPLAVPERPAGEGAVLVGRREVGDSLKDIADIWERRPLIAKGNESLRPLWREWRTAFLADLVAGRVPGVEAGRMAKTVYFDEASNLLGTPRQVSDEKATMAKLLAGLDRTHFKVKLEGESFTPGNEGWWTEGNASASGGKMLVTGWWGGECDAFAETEVPSNGVYSVWLRYMEVAGYLARYRMTVETAAGETVATRELAADEAYNRAHGGFSWVKVEAKLPAGKVRVRVVKTEAGLTYRRVDAAIVTDDPAYVPDGEGLVVPPLDPVNPLTVWRAADPWLGFSRLSAPLPGEGLAPAKVALREGEAETMLLLVRNNTDRPLDATPRMKDDRDGIIRWRVPAFVLSGNFGWQPMPLLERESLTVPPGETAGIWLTVEGRGGFTARTLEVRVGEAVQTIEVEKLAPYGPEVPVPLVFGWTAPYRTVSCWELFRELGINVISDVLVPKAEADRYGIRLTVRLNDGDVSPAHVKYLADRFAKMGYAKKDWAWSFMDEPGNSMADAWTNLATQVKALDPDVRIWVNPGEAENAGAAACLKMLPFADVYCPYVNHFSADIVKSAEYTDRLNRKGSNFELLLGYTTPCFAEKAPSAPLDLLGMKDFAIGRGLDGWAFFALAHGFTYSNSLWDEVNGYMGDQCVNIYPGAACRTLSTRNAEAIRESVRRFRSSGRMATRR